MKKMYPFLLVMLAVAIAGCMREDLNTTTRTAPQSVVPCGAPVTMDLVKNQGNSNQIVTGSVSVYNDAANLYIAITALSPGFINSIALYVGDCSQAPSTGQGNAAPVQFPYQYGPALGVPGYTVVIPLGSLPACYCIAMQVQGGGGLGTSWLKGTNAVPFNPANNSNGYKNTYCTQACPDPCDLSGMRTQTQGGWGAPQANAGNPAGYLQAHFSTCFPAGLTIGCQYTLTLSSADAVRDYLPDGTPPAALTQNHSDPTSPISVLAGQTVTLALNVGFDACDPAFSASSLSLADLVITSGTFQGWTVQQVLALANEAVGGCPVAWSLSDINAAVDAINRNFDNGTTDDGFLTCP